MADGGGPVADRLAEHLRAGTRLNLLPGVPQTGEVLDEAEMRAWGGEHVVDAGVLRDLLRGRTVTDPDPHGIRLRGARIRGRLDLGLLSTTVALELADCLLEDGIDATGARLAGLRLHRCRLRGSGRPAFGGDELNAETMVSFASSVLTARHTDAALRLGGARIGGALSLSGVVVRNEHGAAVDATGLRTDGDLQLDDGFDAEGAGRVLVSLVGAHIGAVLDGRGARLRIAAGRSIDAQRIEVAGAVRFDGVDAGGTVWFPDATIGAHLHCGSATIVAADGPALVVDRAAVAANLYLNRGASAQGAGDGGAVRLVGTRVAGRVNLSGATLRNPTGPGLAADGLQVGGDAQLDDGLTVAGSGPRCAVRLPDARLGGTLRCAGATVTSGSDPTHRWLVDGLTYRGAPRLDPGGQDRDAWLALLREATPAYTAQPYQQLAAAFRAEGHDTDVRTILMRQRRDQLDRGALTGRGERAWARLTGALLGYGYQPWRALVGLAGVLAVSVVLAVVLGGAGGLDRAAGPTPGTPPASPPARVACTPVQTIGAGLDLGTPFLPASRGGSGSCEATTDPPGEALTVARWLLQTAAWALAALFVTGFTGIVRRT